MADPTPLRPDEQVAGGYLHMTLGGELYELKVLPMGLSRKWMTSVVEQVSNIRGKAEELASFDDIANFLAGQSEAMMDSIIAYDVAGYAVLPDREWIDSHATDRECYEGWKRVTAATAPLAEEALRIVPELIPSLIDAFRKAVTKGTAVAMIAIASSESMSSARQSTAGQRISSNPTLPTSSSRSTSKRPRKGASKQPLAS